MNISAGRSAYIVWMLILGIPFLIILIALLFRGFVSGVVPVFFCWSLITLFAFLWLSRFSVKIDNEYICYRSLLSGNNCVRISDITSIKYKTGIEKYTDRFLPTIRLEIEEKKGKFIIINLKVFGQRDVAFLNDFLRSKLL